LGLTYRYFSSKEQLVLALYQLVADEFASAAERQLPSGTLARRFAAALELKLGLIRPYRSLFGVLLRAQLDPDSAIAVLGDQSSDIREQGIAVFRRVVADADDTIPESQHEHLALLLYSLHLGILLLWQYDRRGDGGAADEAIRMAEAGLAMAAPLLALPQAGAALANVSRLFERIAPRVPTARGDETVLSKATRGATPRSSRKKEKRQ
jgi:AcrR family transcriptional regulator